MSRVYNVLSILHTQQGNIVRHLVLSLFALVVSVGPLAAQCGSYPYPHYPPTIIYVPLYVYPATVWGAPTPKPLPPAPPPFVPKAKVSEENPAKNPDTPKIPKMKLDEGPEAKNVLPPPKTAKADEITMPAAKIDEFLIAGREGQTTPSKEVKIGFFNHSAREMVLEVNGETVTLPAEQYVTLRLPRTFKWNVKGDKTREVKVPDDADGLEIVFRK